MHKRGLIKTLLLIIIGIIILGFIGVDLQNVMQKPLIKKNFEFIWDSAKGVWREYIHDSGEETATSTTETLNK